MTWNLWWRFGPWEARAEAIAAVVASEAPDVLLLQEVWATPEGDSSAHRLAALLDYHVALTDDPFVGDRGLEGVGFHNAIVSRWPLLDVVSHALPGATSAEGHRRALLAALATPWGPWTVISTHLDHRFDDSALRQRQAAHLCNVVARCRHDPEVELPVVIGGDFNAVPDSDEVRQLTGRGPVPVNGLVFSDCWEHVGEGAGSTWRRDNPYQRATAWPDRRLDYVFVSWPRPKPIGNPRRAWLAGVDAVNGVTASDHAALVVELVAP